VKAYLITFDPFYANLTAVHTAIVNAVGVEEWWHYLSGTYIVTTNITLQQLKRNLEDNGLTGGNVLIIEVRKSSAGLLPKQAWDWINTRVQ
jgi:hypothetical protein